MQFEPGTTSHGFTVRTSEELAEIDGCAVVLDHESGAQLLFLRNSDSNKAFSIGFRTPPADDTGVFHILEHSVLCGSDRFPVKEPFVNLLKSSMQTFLNAMTFSDKTVYPVASTNEKDLFNLMDVYLDAVFHPQIYRKRAVFEQEGWHYEFADPEAKTGLIYNGVVFNEMKGALSDATSVMYDKLQAQLFPDTCYAFESGGTPEGIPALAYEAYLDEHRRHYRTDNSYIILYGDLDIDRALAFLDERYLAPVAAEQRQRDAERAAAGKDPLRPRSIERQEATSSQVQLPMKTAPENACLGIGYVIGDSNERVRIFAAGILLDALFGSNEAPMKRFILDAGLAQDVHAFISEAVRQPYAVIQLQMPGDAKETSHAARIENELRRLIDEGLDRELIRAALSHAEFELREHDFGIADGVAYAIDALSGWLYDDAATTDYLRYETLFATLHRLIDEGWFDDLARTLICENAHKASVEIVPVPDLPDPIAQRLERMEAQLDDAARERIAAEVEVLRALQEAPDTPEALATLPRLALDDIGDAPEAPAFAPAADAPLPCLRHTVPTHGIAYAYRYFDLSCVAFDELPYVTVLADVLGKLATARHTAAEIDTLMQSRLGNLSFFTETFKDEQDPEVVEPRLVVGASALSANTAWLAALPREIMAETDFSDTTRILDRLQQHKIALEQTFANAGHSCALGRALSYCTKMGVMHEQLGNVGFYRFLCDLIEHFDERAASLPGILEDLAQRIFRDGGCMVSFAGSDEDYARFWEENPQLGRPEAAPRLLKVPTPQILNEAFAVPSDVCFAGVAWDRRLLDAPFDGTWLVAARILSYDYLWNEVRVKGGAYGVGFRASRTGAMRLYSYRDPHLDETLERFEQAAAWLRTFDPEPADMDGFIVATVAGLDAPAKPRALVRRQVAQFLNGCTEERRAAIRHEAASTRIEDVRRVADVIERMVEKHAVCVFGNREILEGSSAGLEVIDLI